MIIVKIYLGTSLALLRAVWGQFSFRQFLVPAYISQGLQAPSNAQSVLSTGFQSVAPVISRVAPSSLFILASAVCKSLQCLISTVTHGGGGGHLFKLTCSVVLLIGRNTANKYTGVCGQCSQCLGHTGFTPAHSRNVCFLSLHCSASRLLCGGTV